MKVLVCGGRNYTNRERVEQELCALEIEHGMLTVIEGGATGADSLARSWAIGAGHALETCPADWEKHGKAAGPIRNQKMLDVHKPDLVLAFAGGRGTADMVRRARVAGVKILEIR